LQRQLAVKRGDRMLVNFPHSERIIKRSIAAQLSPCNKFSLHLSIVDAQLDTNFARGSYRPPTTTLRCSFNALTCQSRIAISKLTRSRLSSSHVCTARAQPCSISVSVSSRDQRRDSPIFLQFSIFFYLFSIFFLNCFLIASNSSGPSSDLAGNSFQIKSDSPTFLNSF
jgi:hypothetical protein